MDKRTFLKTSSIFIAGGLLLRFTGCKSKEVARTNWGGNYTYKASSLEQPRSLEQVQSLVKSHDKLKALGSRHSFNGIADCQEAQVSLADLEQVIAIDEKAGTVTVDGGIRYGKLAPYLHEKGYALANLASLPHISVAGACSTATHGSGDKNGNLATSVRALEIVTADGSILNISRDKDKDIFEGAVVGLGGIGIITKVTLDIQPTFEVKQTVYQNLPISALQDHFDEIMGLAYSVSMFTYWNSDTISQVWLKERITDALTPETKPELYGATLATRNLHPITEVSAENCTEQMGVPGVWYDRLPHFKINSLPSSGSELQTELFVPRKHGLAAFHALNKMRNLIAPVLHCSEFRTVAADNFWMSPCYQQDSLAFHFTWKQDWDGVKKVLPLMEEALAPFSARPHWAKLYTMDAKKLQGLYVKHADFKKLIEQYDPKAKFRNDYLNATIFA